LVEFSDGLARVSMRPRYADGSVGASKYGYIDHSGKWAIPRSFVHADDFHEGLAAAMHAGGSWGYIDRTGRFVIATRFEAASEFSEGLAAVRVGGRWGWIDKTGVIVIPTTFEADVAADQPALLQLLPSVAQRSRGNTRRGPNVRIADNPAVGNEL
jgi:hypothetical protein